MKNKKKNELSEACGRFLMQGIRDLRRKSEETVTVKGIGWVTFTRPKATPAPLNWQSVQS